LKTAVQIVKKPYWRSALLCPPIVFCAVALLGDGLARAATPKPSAQEIEALKTELKDIERTSNEIKFETNADPVTLRAMAGPQAIQALTPKLDRLTQFSAKSPLAEAMARIDLLELTAVMAYWGKPEAITSIDEMAKSDAPAIAVRGKIAQDFLLWEEAHEDEAKQQNAAAAMQCLAAEQPASEDLARAMIDVVNNRPISVKAAHVLNVALAGMKATFAVAYTKLPGRIGEPVVVSGVALKGGDFSTAKWKGKVVMVDFWATWCPPCRASLPEVIERYKKYHDQGFEILGVSSDVYKKDLTSFLAQNTDMVWPQLFTPSPDQMSPQGKKFQIQGVPTVFLIDRNGVLREQECGRPLREEFIVKLLAETANPLPPAGKTAGK
jgi:thiol-disulfide isomerase/thioredoxin